GVEPSLRRLARQCADSGLGTGSGPEAQALPEVSAARTFPRSPWKCPHLSARRLPFFGHNIRETNGTVVASSLAARPRNSRRGAHHDRSCRALGVPFGTGGRRQKAAR